MSIETRKISLAQLLLNVRKESILDKLEKILKEESVVAYSASGEPLTLQDYNQALQEAEQDIQSGRVTSSDELKNEVKSWKK